MQKSGKLELTWVGKYEENAIEPRILMEDKSKSYGDPNTGNMLIHGDNLIALKALEQDFAGKVKCIYIDPPYNADAATLYEDGLEHSIWLGLMRNRLKILKNLLTDDGSILVQIDAYEMAHLKLLMDEIFVRENFVNIITCKTKVAGVSGSHLGNSLQDNVEYILFYAKNSHEFSLNIVPQKQQELMDYIQGMEELGKSWKYTSVMKSIDKGRYISDIIAGNGDVIKLYSHNKVEVCSIKAIADEYFNGDIKMAYYKYINEVFRTTNAQTSIRTKVIEAIKNIRGEYFSIEYIPIKGRNAGKLSKSFYKKDNLIAWLKDVVVSKGQRLLKLDNMGNLWDDIQYNNLTKEGDVQFPNGKKPEALISRIIDMCTEKGDLVLDSFAGSGTTGAVSQKMGRRWIIIELGEHCYTHVIPRLKKVIDGNDSGGITDSVGWQGGGGFKFYELAPSLLKKHPKLPVYQINKSYTFEMLCEAICKIEGFTYKPEGEMHGHSSERRFIHVTREFVSGDYITKIMKEVGEYQSVLIYGIKIQSGLRLPGNVEVKKIPKDLLKKCNFESEVR
ncbi:hypothetical protein AGMMS49587_15320 [Spirochaetia bacterium]|nr:hypothetical protein AGMMS49587_15320 [Spirochaetia bacterium]